MTLTIDLSADAEERLREEAARRGMAAPDLARKLIEDSLPKPQDRLSLEEAEALLDQLADETPDMPVLPRDLIDSRAFYYEDHD